MNYDEITHSVDARAGDILDPSRLAGGLPGGGKSPLPHVLTFSALLGSVARVYRQSDEAIKASRDNARFMRNDVGIMECLESRQRLTALLDWHIQPEDEKSHEQKELCEVVTKILIRMRRFTEYRRCMLEAIWYGRTAIQHRWGKQDIGGRQYTMPMPEPGREHYGWTPINGDKLVFRYEDPRWEEAAEKRGALGGVGILINTAAAAGQGLDRQFVSQTDRGMAYFLPTWQRKLIAIHRHQIEDGPWESPLDAGAVHGVGIRSRIYWEWFQKQECLAYLLEYLERSAAGIEIWEYPSGNADAKTAVEEAASQRGGGNKNAILFPKPAGDDAALFNMHVVEPGMAGAQVIRELLEQYFGHRIKRYILGQTLTSEADATGLGSGLADLHLDTLMQIIKYDARNLEETLTYELVRPILDFNFPHARGIHLEFRIHTEEPNQESVLQSYQAAWTMGARLKESDVLDAIGASVPEGDDVVLQNPQLAQQPGQMPGQMPDDGANVSGQTGHIEQGQEPTTPGPASDVTAAIDLHAALATVGNDGASGDGREFYARDIRAALVEAAALTDMDPSPERKAAGNYRKGSFWCHGFEVTIENPAGSQRRGTDKDGKEWSVTMPHHYGYLRRTSGADGDQVDVFVGDDPACDLVFVVDQIKPDGKFDEHKCMIGFHTEADALKAYRDSYSRDWKGFSAITGMTWKQFSDWLATGSQRKPVAP
jgi:phage gp29-like protein